MTGRAGAPRRSILAVPPARRIRTTGQHPRHRPAPHAASVGAAGRGLPPDGFRLADQRIAGRSTAR